MMSLEQKTAAAAAEQAHAQPVHEVVHDHEADAQQPPVKRVVAVALDASEYSEHALKWAADNIMQPTDLVVLLNVRPYPSVSSPMGTAYLDFSDYLAKMEEHTRAASHDLLRKYAAEIKKHKDNVAVKAIALRGDARDEIVRKVKELNADTLVIGSRGLGAFKRTILGSTSDYLVHHVHCPVVVVRQ